jgi:hypothetical protein
MKMTKPHHPLTPPPELIKQWLGEYFGCKVTGDVSNPELHLATRAAQWGADQELDACCQLLDNGEHAATYGCHNGNSLRTARRPKPPSLAEEALKALRRYETEEWCEELTHDGNIIRRALERLQELEVTHE